MYDEAAHRNLVTDKKDKNNISPIEVGDIKLQILKMF
jgi:hypothetical protein